MLEISFNELSIKIEVASKGEAISIYKAFMLLADKINALKIAPLRLRMCVDISKISISNEFYTLKDWLRTLTHEERQRYAAYIVQNSILVDNPAYYYKEEESKGFGYAINNDLGSVSYSTNEVWLEDSYSITRLKNSEKDQKNIEIDEAKVYHCLLTENKPEQEQTKIIVNHAKWLRNGYRAKQSAMRKSLINIEDLWNKREELFQWLDFGKDVQIQLRHFDSLTNQSLKKIINYLIRLNNHLDDVNTSGSDFDDFPGDVTNDGEATLDKYGKERNLPTHTGETYQFSQHAKLGGDTRVYLMPRKAEKRVTVGYIGDHMKTKNFK